MLRTLRFPIGSQGVCGLGMEPVMAAKIFIKRHIKAGRVEEALQMINDFRKKAMDQPGYLSGETLVNHYDARCLVVVSTWRTVEDWIRWQDSDARDCNEALIEGLLDKPTAYEVFDIRSATG